MLKQPQVRDKYGLVYGILVLMGVGTLMPWNVFMTEKEFWDIRLHQDPFNPYVAHNFMNLFAIVFNVTNLVAFLIMICMQAGWSMNTQIFNPLLVIGTVLATTALVALRVDLSGDVVGAYALPAMGIMGMCMAVLQGGALNLASMFPPIYIQGFVVGAGLSGVATSVLSLISQLGAAEAEGGDRTATEVAPAAFMYFGAATAIVALCVGGYSLLPRLDYSRARLAPYIASRRAVAAAAAAAGGTDLTAQLLPGGGGGDGPSYPSKDPNVLPSHSGPYRASGSGDAECAALPPAAPHLMDEYALDGPIEPSLYGMPPRSMLVFSLYALATVLTMGASLAVFPGVAAFICSENNPATVSPCAAHTPHGRLYGDLFVPVLFVLFALGDLTGRVASSWGPWGQRPPPALALVAYALVRCALVAALLVCHVVTPTPWRLPTLLQQDYWPLGLVALLGLTQGHLLSTACMHAPAVVPPEKAAEFGPVTGLCITVGCLLGSIASSFIMRYLAA